MASQASGVNIIDMEGKTKESSAMQQVGDNQIKQNNSNGNSEIFIPMPMLVGLMHKAPEMLQQPQLRKYFVPRVVSLGPYHHNKKVFLVTEHDKRTMKFHLLRNKKVEDFEEMRIALENAKALYVEDHFSNCNISDDFNDMMILDACFIVYVIDHITTKKLPVPGISAHHLPLVVEDMFLLENQVPFRVLEAVMKFLGRIPEDMIPLFLDRINQDSIVTSPRTWLESFFESIEDHCHWGEENKEERMKKKKKKDTERIKRKKGTSKERFMRDGKHLHLLQILRDNLLSYPKMEVSKLSWRPSRCAAELKMAGIDFERGWTDSLADVEFKSGIIFGRLRLPSINHLTKRRLLNLIAYELGSEGCDYGITSYVCFLDGLIDHPEDVKELRSKNILPKGLGSDEEVADFFNMVGNDLALPPSYNKVLKDIEAHCHAKWRADMAGIYNTYFSSSLATISFVIATLLLVITIAQAYLAFFPVKK